MMNAVFDFVILIFMEATKTAQKAEFSWRDALSMVGILIPLLLGLYLYLVRKKQEAEKELRDQQLQSIKDSIKRAQDDVDEALSKLEDAVRVHFEHKELCANKYVNQDVYKQDMETQVSHVASMRTTIDTLNSMLMQQQQLMTNLVKTIS